MGSYTSLDPCVTVDFVAVRPTSPGPATRAAAQGTDLLLRALERGEIGADVPHCSTSSNGCSRLQRLSRYHARRVWGTAAGWKPPGKSCYGPRSSPAARAWFRGLPVSGLWSPCSRSCARISGSGLAELMTGDGTVFTRMGIASTTPRFTRRQPHANKNTMSTVVLFRGCVMDTLSSTFTPLPGKHWKRTQYTVIKAPNQVVGRVARACRETGKRPSTTTSQRRAPPQRATDFMW